MPAKAYPYDLPILTFFYFSIKPIPSSNNLRLDSPSPPLWLNDQNKRQKSALKQINVKDSFLK